MTDICHSPREAGTHRTCCTAQVPLRDGVSDQQERHLHRAQVPVRIPVS